MERQELLRVLEASWQALDAATTGLGTTELEEPGVVGPWAVVEVLGHVTAWEQQALRLIGQWQRGEPLGFITGPGVDSYNAAEAARRRGWSPEQIRAEQAETRRQLRAAIAAADDEAWAAPLPVGDQQWSIGRAVAGALGGDGPGDHAAEHARQIQAWRARRGPG